MGITAIIYKELKRGTKDNEFINKWAVERNTLLSEDIHVNMRIHTCYMQIHEQYSTPLATRELQTNYTEVLSHLSQNGESLKRQAGQWRCTLYIPELQRDGRSLWIRGQPHLHSEFLGSQCYTWRPCLREPVGWEDSTQKYCGEPWDNIVVFHSLPRWFFQRDSTYLLRVCIVSLYRELELPAWKCL